jgi:hypothetical protein
MCKCPYLFRRHRVAHDHEKNKPLKPSKRVQIRKLRNPILSQDQCLQIGNAGRQIRLDIRDAVLRQKQRAQARLEREIGELGDVVVGQVDCVVVLKYQVSAQRSIPTRSPDARRYGTYPCSAHVLNGGDFVAYSLQTLISIQLASAVFVLFYAPRRSSSRSVRQLMKERELLIRSVVNLMLAVGARFALLLVEGNGVDSLVGARRAYYVGIELLYFAGFGVGSTNDMGNSQALPSFVSAVPISPTYSHSASPAGTTVAIRSMVDRINFFSTFKRSQML